MQLPGAGNPHPREVVFAKKADVRLTKALAVLVAVSALVVAGIPLFTPLPWLVLLTAMVGIFLLLLAGALWMSEADNVKRTQRLQAHGVLGHAEILDSEAVENESISYRIDFRVRVTETEPFDVTHLCSHWRCVDAVTLHQAGQPAGMVAIAMPATGEWMIVH